MPRRHKTNHGFNPMFFGFYLMDIKDVLHPTCKEWLATLEAECQETVLSHKWTKLTHSIVQSGVAKPVGEYDSATKQNLEHSLSDGNPEFSVLDWLRYAPAQRAWNTAVWITLMRYNVVPKIRRVLLRDTENKIAEKSYSLFLTVSFLRTDYYRPYMLQRFDQNKLSTTSTMWQKEATIHAIERAKATGKPCRLQVPHPHLGAPGPRGVRYGRSLPQLQ